MEWINAFFKIEPQTIKDSYFAETQCSLISFQGPDISGRCKKYSDQTDQTDQTGQMTKDIFGDSQVGSSAWELVYF